MSEPGQQGKLLYEKKPTKVCMSHNWCTVYDQTDMVHKYWHRSLDETINMRLCTDATMFNHNNTKQTNQHHIALPWKLKHPMNRHTH
jgi:hypothetical protein